MDGLELRAETARDDRAVNRQIDEPILRLAATISTEVALYAAVVGLAIFLRLRDLTALPLGMDEARRAFEAWRLVEGHVAGSWAEPLPTLLAAGSFFAFGSGDLAARVGPALVGCALPALCWLLRPLIGRGPSLWAALLLAVSPLAVYYARTLSGDGLVVALSLVLVAVVFHYLRSSRPRYVVLAAATLPALLLSSPNAISVLLIGLLFFALLYAFGSSKVLTEAWRSLAAEGDLATRLLAVVLVGFLLLSTALLTNLASFGVPTLGTWLAQFTAAPSSASWYYHLELLLSYEPLVLALGLSALVLLFGRGRSIASWWASIGEPEADQAGPAPIFVLFVAFWAVLGLLLLLITGTKTSGQVSAVLLPFVLLASIGLHRLVSWLPWPLERAAWVLMPALAAVVGFFLIMLSQVTQGPEPKAQQTVYLLLSAGAVLLVLAASALQLRRQVGPLLVTCAVIALAAASLHATARVSHRVGAAELIFPGRAQADVADAVRQIKTFARQSAAREDLVIVVDGAVQQPFRWYLRDYKKLTVGGQAADGPSVVIAPWSGPAQTGAGTDGYIVRVGESLPFQPRGPLEYWRWLIYGEARSAPSWIQAVLQFRG